LQEFPGTTPDRPEDPAGYKPLSLLAVLGLIISGTYGVFLIIWFLFSLLTRSPMLTLGLSLLWPVIGILVSVFGWLQVQRSEGTKGGRGLAVWGILIGVLFGLGYAAYYLAGSLAINTQAEIPILAWFDLIKNDKIEEAFLMTMPPEQRPTKSGAALREELEARFSTSEGGRPGQLPMFALSELVRFVAQGGQQTKITPLGVKDWAPENNGYMVRHLYQVSTPEAEFEALVTVFGVEPKGGQGRLWQIRLGGETGIIREKLRPTKEGARISALEVSANKTMNRWFRALAEGNAGEAYLLTREPDERTRLSPFPAVLDDLPGYQEFRQGALVKAEPDQFWAPEKLKFLPDKLKKMFGEPDLFRHPSSPSPGRPMVTFQPRSQLSRWAEEQGRLRFFADMELTMLTVPEGGDQSYSVGYMMQGVVVMETSPADVDPARAEWRVVGVNLRRASVTSSGPGGAPPPPTRPRPPG
jgi:hypothetical protein